MWAIHISRTPLCLRECIGHRFPVSVGMEDAYSYTSLFLVFEQIETYSCIDMKRHHLVFNIAFALVVISAIALRLMSQRNVQMHTRDTDPNVSSAIPAFMSASVSGGDVLQGLGPEWTYLRQQDPTTADGAWLKGTVPMREALVKVSGKNVQMFLVELRIENDRALQSELTSSTSHKATVAGREGYVIPMNDLAGGTGFALVGTRRVLVIQHGQSNLWPSSLESEILSYIASVQVP